MRRSVLALPVVFALSAAVPLPAQAAGLSRDPVTVVYDRDHALHLANGGATDDDLRTRTATLAGDAWSFYRGTAPLYYRDLGELPASAYATAGGDVWLTGDAHLENTGADRGADGTTQYQLTDTDDAWRGSWTWELRREAVSIVLAGRQQGRSEAQLATDVNTFVAEYAQWIDKFHGNDDERTWRLTASNTSDVSADLIDKSTSDSRADLLKKWTTVSGGTRTFAANDKLATVPAATRTDLANAVAAYRGTAVAPLSAAGATVKDVRRRLGAGTGSLGRYRWYVLVEGATTSTSDDRILELKQQVSPAPAVLAPNSTSLTGGQRAASALRWEVAQADPLAGWANVGSVPVLVREKSPYAEDFSIDDPGSAADWDDTVRDVARLLAAAHARADQDSAGSGVGYSADAAIDGAITSVSGLQAETRAFATSYADQVVSDWKAYVAAKNSGRPLF